MIFKRMSFMEVVLGAVMVGLLLTSCVTTGKMKKYADAQVAEVVSVDKAKMDKLLDEVSNCERVRTAMNEATVRSGARYRETREQLDELYVAIQNHVNSGYCTKNCPLRKFLQQK